MITVLDEILPKTESPLVARPTSRIMDASKHVGLMFGSDAAITANTQVLCDVYDTFLWCVCAHPKVVS
jgi:hypothetical protein